MAEARQRGDWARTSSIMALIANVNRDPKKHRPFTPADFDPFVKATVTRIEADVSVLRDMFVNGRAPGREAST